MSRCRDPLSVTYSHPRWAIGPDFDEDGNELPDTVRVMVKTAEGTGRRAVGIVSISRHLADRRYLARFVREARNVAMQFRKEAHDE